MKLSVITVTLNNLPGLKRTMESVFSQNYDSFEWIVIDGGSNDGSKTLLEDNTRHISYWISESDKGIYNAMNKGIRQANGEYVLFLNSGDWLFSTSTLRDCFNSEHTEDILYGEISFRRGQEEYQRSELPDNLGFNFLAWNFIGHSSNCFIKRQRLLEYPYDENLKIVSDWKFYLQAAFAGATFKHLDMCVGCYDLSGISERSRELSRKERKMVFEECIPPIVKNDAYQNKQLEAYLANTSIEEFITIRSKHKLLGKLITLTITLMKRFK